MANTGSRKFLKYTGLSIISGPMALLFWPDGWLIVTAALSIVGGFYGLGFLLTNPAARANFLLFGAVVVVLVSAAGMLFSFVSISWVDYEIWSLFLDYTHVMLPDLALVQGVANAFAIVLWLLGNRLQRSGLMDSIFQQVIYALDYQKKAVWLLSMGTLACQFYLLNGSVVVYGGKDIADESAPVHPLLALVLPLVPVLPLALAYYVRGYFQNSRWLAGLLTTALLLGELYWFFLFGRRSIVYFFVLLITGFSFGKALTVRAIFRNLIPLGLSVFVMLTIADTYHKMRTMYGFNALQRMNVAEGVAGLQNLDNEQYGNIRRMNMAVRSSYSSLAVARFVNLFRTTSYQPLAGQVLLNSMLLATPSDFLVDKSRIMAKELLYERAYALSLTDISETLYLEAFIDFGWLGCFIYGGFIFGLFYTLYALIHRSRSPIGCLIASCAGIYLALTLIETDMISFLAALRTLFVYCVLVGLFSVRRSHQPKTALIP